MLKTMDPRRRTRAPVELIAVDLDGTLLDARERVSPANRQALLRARARGIGVVVVTGRGVDAIERLVPAAAAELPAICAHGALVKQVPTGRTLSHRTLPLAQSRRLLAFASERRLDVAAYDGERFYRERGSTTYMEDQRRAHWIEVDSLCAAPAGAPTMLRFLGRRAVAEIRTAFAEGTLSARGLHLKYETWGEFEECAVTRAGAHKARALADLCAALGIGRSAVMAIGDSRNDLPMLAWAGYGVAMGNAPVEVRAAVAHVTDSCERDGVAQAIARLALAETRERSA